MTIEGLPHLIRTLEEIERAHREGMASGATVVKDVAAQYPDEPHGRKQPFKTARQRRGFFAKLRSGEIEAPWRRGSSPGSQKLGSQWQIRVSEYWALIFNLVKYGPLVQGTQRQSLFHKGTGWKTEKRIQQDSSKRVLEEFEKSYHEAIHRR